MNPVRDIADFLSEHDILDGPLRGPDPSLPFQVKAPLDSISKPFKDSH